MKRLAILSVVTAMTFGIAASNAATATTHRHPKDGHAIPRNAFNQIQATPSENDPYGVYLGGREIGRDPDPNVRQQLLRDYYAVHGDGG